MSKIKSCGICLQTVSWKKRSALGNEKSRLPEYILYQLELSKVEEVPHSLLELGLLAHMCHCYNKGMDHKDLKAKMHYQIKMQTGGII